MLLSTSLLLTVLVVAATALYCQANRIGSYDDWVARNSALAARYPICVALRSGVLKPGTSTADLLSVSTPTQFADFGRLQYFWFRPAQENCQVAICVDGEVATVLVTGRDFSWTFFDDPDPELISAMQTVRSIRDHIDADQALAGSLDDKLNPALLTLKLPLDQPLPADNQRLQRSP